MYIFTKNIDILISFHIPFIDINKSIKIRQKDILTDSLVTLRHSEDTKTLGKHLACLIRDNCESNFFNRRYHNRH